MRSPTNADKVRRFMEAFGRGVHGPGRVYLLGGTSAVLTGWRETTVDIDLKLDPEPPGAFEAIARLKEELDMNVELSAPDDFIPALPGWRERSRFVASHGEVDYYHYDFCAQALAKIERGHAQDVQDVKAMLRRRLVSADELRRLFDSIESDLIRYPAVDPGAFRERLDEMLSEDDDE